MHQSQTKEYPGGGASLQYFFGALSARLAVAVESGRQRQTGNTCRRCCCVYCMYYWHACSTSTKPHVNHVCTIWRLHPSAAGTSSAALHLSCCAAFRSLRVN